MPLIGNTFGRPPAAITMLRAVRVSFPCAVSISTVQGSIMVAVPVKQFTPKPV